MDILFVTATRIGDAVLSTGLLAYLVDRYPGARLTIAAGPIAAPLFEAVPGLERLIVVEKRRWALHWLPLYAAVGARRWDLVVDLRRLGPGVAAALRRTQGGRQGRRARTPCPPTRASVRPRSCTRAAVVDRIPPRPRGGGADPRRGAGAGVGPAANWRGKQWRGERFAELARRLTGPDGPLPGARVAVLAAGHERGQALPLIETMPANRLIDLVGRVDLLTAAAALRRCALFVGNDTGLMHIAAATGTPTLGLFGPSPIEKYAPWGSRTAVARTADAPETMFGPGFNHLTTQTLMDSLSVDAAETAAHQLWRRVASAAA